jgi:hypothetical protein
MNGTDEEEGLEAYPWRRAEWGNVSGMGDCIGVLSGGTCKKPKNSEAKAISGDKKSGRQCERRRYIQARKPALHLGASCKRGRVP